MNVAVYWYTNVHNVDNGGHGFSLGYKRGAFMESFLKERFVKQGRLVLCSVIFSSIIAVSGSLKFACGPNS